MAFKIASAYVAVTPEDDGFEAGLRRIVDDAAAKVKAQVGAGLNKDATQYLREDLDIAIDLATNHLEAKVGLGLRNDALEELDADVKAGVELVGEENKVKVKVDAKAAKDSFGGLSPMIVGAFTAAASIGPGILLAATAAAVIGAGALVTKGNADLADSYQRLGSSAADMITSATQPLVPQLEASVGILQRGLLTVGPELQRVFEAAAPDVTSITTGLVGMVSNTLPGMASGLRAIAPFANDLAVDFGRIGAGLGGFFEGLGTGARGGMVGFNALTNALEHLLTDLGLVVGALANGLGPALRDVLNVAVPLTDGLARIVAAFPPQVIESAAVATGLLFAAFKVGTLTNIVAEGTTFLGFLKGLLPAEVAVTEETGVLSGAMTRLGAAAMSGAGLLGILAGVTTGLYYAIRNDNGSMNDMIDKIAAQAKAEQQQLDVLNQATQAADAQANSFDALSGALTDVGLKMQQNAEKTAATTLAELGARDGTDAVTTAMNASLQAYSEASDAANGYKSALDGLYNKYADYSQAQATFTEQLDAAAKSLIKGKDAVNLNSEAGAKNFTTLNQLAQANEQVAESFIKQGGSVDDANKKLQAGALEIDNMAKKAGFSATQVQQLNQMLYGTANIKDIKVQVSADTAPAVNYVDSLLGYIDHKVAYIQVQAIGGSPGGKALLTNADGGSVGAGDYSVVGERGPEIVQFGRAGTVIPNEAIRRVAGDTSLSKASSLGGVTIQNLTIPITGIVDLTDPNSMTAAARRMVIQLNNALIQVRNGRTGATY